MTATAALHEQIKRYQQMTGEQRLAVALDLHEISCDIAREGIRRQIPKANPEEVERLLHQWIERERETRPKQTLNAEKLHWKTPTAPTSNPRSIRTAWKW